MEVEYLTQNQTEARHGGVHCNLSTQEARQEDYKFKAIPIYKTRPGLKQQQKNSRTRQYLPFRSQGYFLYVVRETCIYKVWYYSLVLECHSNITK
jgi:hypothetical protein